MYIEILISLLSIYFIFFITMAKRENGWTILVKKTMKENPGMKFKDVLKKAKILYSKTKKSASNVMGSKSKRRRGSSKRRKSMKKSRKSSRK